MRINPSEFEVAKLSTTPEQERIRKADRSYLSLEVSGLPRGR